MSDSLTLVTIISSDSRDPGSTAYSRAWRISPESAGAFIKGMTKLYGEPITEGLSTVGAMRAAAERNAEDGFLFTDREDGPGAG